MEWQAIEKAPERAFGQGTVDVLLYGKDLGVYSGRAARYPDGFVFAGVAHIVGNLAHDGFVTHWMPLPDPPVIAPSGAEGSQR